ncbi:hypothetical protein PG989_001299 [Apiospora arundinis]
MEINNSFDEKRNILFRVRSCRPEPEHEKAHSDESGQAHANTALYTGSWTKEVYASPFERVDGTIVEKLVDPLQDAHLVSGETMMTTSAFSDEGKLKFVTRLSFDGNPIDPAQATFTQLVRIILRWTMPGTLTTPRIIFQAMRLHHYLGTMKMKDKPVIRPGSVPRHATKTEEVVERVFRKWLEFVVQESPEVSNLVVQYSPSRSISNETIRIRPEQWGSDGDPTPHTTLEVEPVDPGFYGALVQAKDIGQILAEQMEPCGSEADPLACVLLVNDSKLLLKLATGSASMAALPTLNAPAYALDRFVQSHADQSLASAYWAVTRQRRVIDYLFIGYRRILKSLGYSFPAWDRVHTE